MSRKETAARKKEQIMKAAESLFADRRYHELTIDEIAKVAKVGKGTVYRYFKDKEDLFMQTAGWGWEELCDALEQGMPKGAPFEVTLLRACEEMGGFFSKRWQLLRMMQELEQRGGLSKLSKGYMRQGGERLQTAIAGIMKQGQQEGRLRKDVKPVVLAALFRGLLRPMSPVMWQMERKKRYALVVEIFCRGAGAKRGKK